MKKLAIGIDIGGTRTKIGLVDIAKGEVIDLLIIPTEKYDSEKFIQGINKAICTFKTIAEKEKYQIKGVGFGIPGFTFKNGIVDSTYGFLEFMEDYPLKKIIEDEHQIPCVLDNDARVVALGEALYGEGVGFERILVLTLGTGLGVGFIVNQKLNEPLPYAHMAGHITVVKSDVECYCGKTGCLEALVSATGLSNAAIKENWQNQFPDEEISAENIFKQRGAKNKVAEKLINTLIEHLKTGINNYLNIYAPDVVILGGGMAKGLAQDIAKLYSPDLMYAFKNYKTELKLSVLEEEAGILGAAALLN